MTAGASLHSVRWGYFRIIAGTVLGGVLGFYVMHRVENSYKVSKHDKRYRNKRGKKTHISVFRSRPGGYGKSILAVIIAAEKVKERLARYEKEMMLKDRQQQRREADGGDQLAE
ncbi:hypothetical protein Taro_033390 [Colocasia esculenta]|uniref:Uncharacterized protein n=1 Tax=Colocasia esculenta TaxID=4460 RepID=A0A843VV63_COLES|nr:hypothetical protein [Colocasia esculenta]